jgi:adhesin transport system outer membrane protein
MLNMRWNLFNSGADAAGVRAAQARVRQSRQVMYNFVDEMSLEIENTWVAYASSQEQHRHYQDAAKFSASTCSAYEDQFRVGQRSLLDVLDGYSELFNASTQVATAQGNVLIGAYRLLAVVGGLLSSLEIDDSFLQEAPAPAPEEPREGF